MVEHSAFEPSSSTAHPPRDSQSRTELLDALRRLLSRRIEPFVIDVGANDGSFILEVNDLLPIRALCIEPGVDAHSRLAAVAEYRPNIRTLNVAIDEVRGEADFFVAKSDVGSSLLLPVAGQLSEWATTVAKVRVPTVRLDEILERESEVDLLKVDTQGTDLRVLRSGAALLAPEKVGAILVESNFHQIYEGQDSFGDLYHLLVGKGYFMADFFRYFNRKGWLWYADALFLPTSSEFAT